MAAGCGRPLTMDEVQSFISPCRPRLWSQDPWLPRVFSIALMRAVRSDVLRETHQRSRSRDKIGQGKVYYRDTECITKLYLGSRMTDADKKKIEEALAQLARQGKKVMQFLQQRRYIVVVVDGKVKFYGTAASSESH